jgi:hypothetical protein
MMARGYGRRDPTIPGPRSSPRNPAADLFMGDSRGNSGKRLGALRSAHRDVPRTRPPYNVRGVLEFGLSSLICTCRANELGDRGAAASIKAPCTACVAGS